MTSEQRPRLGDGIKQTVNERYGAIAERVLAELGEDGLTAWGDLPVENVEAGCCAAGAGVVATIVFGSDPCCGPTTEPSGVEGTRNEGIEDGSRFYSQGESDALPRGAVTASLGCGNPVAIAELNPGERVLDLGSGGGIDCLLSARQVGVRGEVWGLDMTPSMVRLARRNAEKMDVTNVRFRLGEIEDIPFAENHFDAIISNCVINLSPDKAQVFREAFRVLKPGGRLRVSDMVWTRDVRPEERGDAEAWVACVAGALPLSEYLEAIEAAGFVEVGADYREDELSLVSADVRALKPA